MSVPDSEKECPLCMEALDWDDLGFFPCSCGYQICRFCWHRLRTDENGLCPACRQAFPDIPVSFNPEISAEELKKQKKRNKERRSKDQVFKPQDLATLRVVQKNLVFVIGLPSRLTQEDLRKEFAHFGKIIKFVHNKSTAYITYSKPEEAIRAIRTLNASAAQESALAAQQIQQQPQQFQQPTTQQLTNGTTTTPAQQLQQQQPATTIPNGIVGLNNNVASLGLTNSFLNSLSMPVPPNRLKASLGTTKYCNHFLRSQQCPKVGECMYLHEIADAEASFTKEQMQAGKHVEYEKKLMDSYLVVQQPTSHSRYPAGNQPPSVLLTSSQQLQAPPPAPPLPPVSQPTSQQQQQQQPLPPQLILEHHQLHMQQPQSQQQTLQDQLQKQIQIQLRQSPPPPLPLPPPQQQQHQPSQLQQQQQQQSLLLQQHQLDQPTPLQQSQQLQQLHLQQQLELELQRQSPSEPTRPSQLTQQQQSQLHQQQQRQLNNMLDTDSEDDGLDFDPISVSASGLRDLLDQQVQQAKQLQMQSYFQQMNSTNQSLASVLFQQSNRLNHPTQTNGLIRDAPIDGLPQSLPSLASLTNPASQQQQVTWQNLSAWTNFLQRSGFGFENSR